MTDSLPDGLSDSATSDVSPSVPDESARLMEQWLAEEAKQQSAGYSTKLEFRSHEGGYSGTWKATVTKDGPDKDKKFSCKLGTSSKEKYKEAGGEKTIKWCRAGFQHKKETAKVFLDMKIVDPLAKEDE